MLSKENKHLYCVPAVSENNQEQCQFIKKHPITYVLSYL